MRVNIVRILETTEYSQDYDLALPPRFFRTNRLFLRTTRFIVGVF